MVSADRDVKELVRQAAAAPLEPIQPSTIRQRALARRRRRRIPIGAVSVAGVVAVAALVGGQWPGGQPSVLVAPASNEITGETTTALEPLEGTVNPTLAVTVEPDEDSSFLAEHEDVVLTVDTSTTRILCDGRRQAAGHLGPGMSIRATTAGGLDRSFDPPRLPVSTIRLTDCQEGAAAPSVADAPPISLQVLVEPSRSHMEVPDGQWELIRSQNPDLDPETVAFATTNAGASYLVAGTPEGPLCLIHWDAAHTCVDDPRSAAARHGVVVGLAQHTRRGVASVAYLVPDPYTEIVGDGESYEVTRNVAVVDLDPTAAANARAELVGPGTSRLVDLPP